MRLNGLMHFLCSFEAFSKKDTGGDMLYIFLFYLSMIVFHNWSFDVCISLEDSTRDSESAVW